jgi:hypothetical protein
LTELDLQVLLVNLELIAIFTGQDGIEPYAGVTVDKAGNIYGTT